MAAKRASTTKQAEAPATQPGPKPLKRGAKSKRTPEIRQALLEALEIGLADVHACACAGVGQPFFYLWIREDEQFAQDVKRARGACVRILQEQIASHAGEDWRAGAWLLARRFPGEYAERQILSVDADNGSPLDRFMKGENDSTDSAES